MGLAAGSMGIAKNCKKVGSRLSIDMRRPRQTQAPRHAAGPAEACREGTPVTARPGPTNLPRHRALGAPRRTFRRGSTTISGRFDPFSTGSAWDFSEALILGILPRIGPLRLGLRKTNKPIRLTGTASGPRVLVRGQIKSGLAAAPHVSAVAALFARRGCRFFVSWSDDAEATSDGPKGSEAPLGRCRWLTLPREDEPFTSPLRNHSRA
jgi:hypothetical protein